MITLLVGTNRPNSRARRIANYYSTILADLGAESQILDLAELPVDFIVSALYENVGTNPAFNSLAQMLDAGNMMDRSNPKFSGVVR